MIEAGDIIEVGDPTSGEWQYYVLMLEPLLPDRFSAKSMILHCVSTNGYFTPGMTVWIYQWHTKKVIGRTDSTSCVDVDPQRTE